MESEGRWHSCDKQHPGLSPASQALPERENQNGPGGHSLSRAGEREEAFHFLFSCHHLLLVKETDAPSADLTENKVLRGKTKMKTSDLTGEM